MYLLAVMFVTLFSGQVFAAQPQSSTNPHYFNGKIRIAFAVDFYGLHCHTANFYGVRAFFGGRESEIYLENNHPVLNPRIIVYNSETDTYGHIGKHARDGFQAISVTDLLKINFGSGEIFLENVKFNKLKSNLEISDAGEAYVPFLSIKPKKVPAPLVVKLAQDDEFRLKIPNAFSRDIADLKNEIAEVKRFTLSEQAFSKWAVQRGLPMLCIVIAGTVAAHYITADKKKSVEAQQ